MSKEEILKKHSNGNGWFEEEFEAISAAMTEYAHRAIEEAAASALDGHMSNAPGDTIVDEILKLKEKY